MEKFTTFLNRIFRGADFIFELFMETFIRPYDKEWFMMMRNPEAYGAARTLFFLNCIFALALFSHGMKVGFFEDLYTFPILAWQVIRICHLTGDL